MIYITGDCHAEWDRFYVENFPEQEDMTREDYVIVCGDFGIWDSNSVRENLWLDWLSRKKFTLLFCDGNHENFDQLEGYEVVDFHGGKAHRIRENIYHLMRGYIFDLCGKKFFVFGGARSHDIQDGILDAKNYPSREAMLVDYDVRTSRYGEMLRINHESWWEQEMPSREEMEFGMTTLGANDDKVDFIVSHCCPQEIASLMSGGLYKKDELTMYFNVIANTVEFSKWFFGHYHDNQQFLGKYVLLYEQIVRIL